MRILFSIHLYLPQHAAGGELYCHNMAKHLVSKGHEVRVLLHEAFQYNIERMYTYEGIEVFPVTAEQNNAQYSLNWADIIITHLGWTKWTLQIARIMDLGKPVFFISHNTWIYDCIVNNPWVKVIYNSFAMRERLQYKNDSIVLHPVCDWRKYDDGQDPSKNEYITLINLNKNKGAKIFFNIARAMPEKKFLAVKGGYDPQWIEELPNVTIVENTPDIKSIYAKTRILLMPSKYESWGMCATEAMASGIPVIYSPTFGLDENVATAGIRIENPNPDWEDPDLEKTAAGDTWENPGIDPSNYMAWVKAIRRLNDPIKYKIYSSKARKRSRDLDPEKELDAIEQFFLASLHDKQTVNS